MVDHLPPLTRRRKLHRADPEYRAPASATGGPEKYLHLLPPGITSCLNLAQPRVSLCYSPRPERATGDPAVPGMTVHGALFLSVLTTNRKGRDSAGGR